MQKIIVFFLFMFFTRNFALSQTDRLTCDILHQILSSFKTQKAKLKVYHFLENKIHIIGDSTGENQRIINDSNLPNSTIDSLVRVSDFYFITEDSIYYIYGITGFFDSLKLFSSNCACFRENKNIVYIDRHGFSVKKGFNQVITVKAIKIYKGNLVIGLKSSKSPFIVSFAFELINNKPRLIKIFSD